MVQRRHRIDWSLLRRRQNSSATSSTSLSPTIPVLESPVTFQALISQNVSETTLKRNNKLHRTPVTPSMFFEEKDDEDSSLSRLTRRLPADGKTVHLKQHSSVEEEPITRTKSQYFEDVFSTRGPSVSPATRVNQDSLVVIEIKIKNEDSLVASILSRMARIYQKPETYMMVTLQKDTYLRLGSSSLPAYLIKVFALPYLIAPITNLRSTVLTQRALYEFLGIPPHRGVVLYIPIAEENMATNSTTMMSEIERLERESQEQEPGIFRTLSRSMGRKKKSTSGHSAPLSDATTSSWAAGSDGREMNAPSTREPQNSNASTEEGRPRPSRTSNTLRQFVSRRFPDRSEEASDAD